MKIMSFLYPIVSEDRQQKIIGKYISVIVSLVQERFDLDYHAAVNAVVESGILNIIDEDPVTNLHFDPEEWIENIEAHFHKSEISVRNADKMEAL